MKDPSAIVTAMDIIDMELAKITPSTFTMFKSQQRNKYNINTTGAVKKKLRDKLAIIISIAQLRGL